MFSALDLTMRSVTIAHQYYISMTYAASSSSKTAHFGDLSIFCEANFDASILVQFALSFDIAGTEDMNDSLSSTLAYSKFLRAKLACSSAR